MPELEKLDMDTADAYRDLEALDRAAKMTAASVLSVVKRGYQSMTLMVEVLGGQIPPVFDMVIQSLFLVAETIVTLSAAESLTGVGVLKASIDISMAYVLFVQALTLHRKNQEILDKTNKTLQALRIWM